MFGFDIWHAFCKWDPWHPAGGTTVQMGGIVMLEILAKLVDLIETILAKEIDGEHQPEGNDRLVAIGNSLEAMAMDIKDRTSEVP